MAKSFAIDVDLSTGAGITAGLINVSGDDTLYYRFMTTGPSAPTTAVITAHTHRHVDEPGLPIGAGAIDGTVATIPLVGVEFVSFAVTTTEATKRGTLYIQSRKTQE